MVVFVVDFPAVGQDLSGYPTGLVVIIAHGAAKCIGYCGQAAFLVSGFVVEHGGGALVRAISLGYGGQAAPVVVGHVDIFQARNPVGNGPAFFVLDYCGLAAFRAGGGPGAVRCYEFGCGGFAVYGCCVGQFGMGEDVVFVGQFRLAGGSGGHGQARGGGQGGLGYGGGQGAESGVCSLLHAVGAAVGRD